MTKNFKIGLSVVMFKLGFVFGGSVLFTGAITNAMFPTEASNGMFITGGVLLIISVVGMFWLCKLIK